MYPEDPGSVTAKIRVSINDIVYLTEETSTGVDSHSNPIMVPVHISDLEFSINIDVEASSEYPGLLMISPIELIVGMIKLYFNLLLIIYL